MSLNMKSFTQALAKTAAVIEKTVQSTVQEVTGPKPLQDYELVDQVGSGGLGMVWKLYSGRPRNKAEHAHNPEVCVWVLDKKAVAEIRQREGMTKGTEDAFLEIIRADAAQLMKLRHPGVIRVIQALDESKTAMAMVTEPIFCSVSNVLGNMDNVAKFPKELKGLVLGQLEIKHGLLQLAESLHFLHNNAQLIHRAISPETVFITTSGSWKFAGFGHSVSIEQAASEVNAGSPFHYPDYDVEEVFMPLHPHLDYTAPELTRGSGAKRTSSDIFSLACLAYHLISREPLICSKSNLLAYRNTLSYLTSQSFSKMPTDLIQDLQRMLSSDELSRPTANEFTGSPYFRDDTRLRALRFLDHMLERDNMQKTDFLKALSNMWVEFDSRVLRYKVLPPLCSELRNAVMLPMVLPMVLTIAESQEKSDFESSTLPSLLPVLNSASGESLLFLVKHAALLINKVPENMVATVVSMLVRAYDDPDARMQEEVLKRTVFIAKQIDYQVLKQSILSRIHGLALKTTVAAVRVNALLCLGEIVHRLDRNTIGDVLQTLQRCTAVDRSAATLMCTLGVANAIHKQFGLEYSVEHLLPLLTPLLVAQQLNSQQFTKYMHFVKDILRQIEEKRGLTSKKESVNGSAVAAEEMKSKISSSWDKDDWSSQLNSKAKPNILPSFEWPPPSTATATANSIVTATAAATVTETATAAQSVSDDVDPFADWPPRSYSNNSQQIQQQQQQQKKMMNKKSFHDVNSMSWSSKKPDEFLRLPPPPPSSSSTSSLPLSTSSLPSSFSSSSSSSSSTSSSIGLGRGRGRGRGRNSIGQIKSSKTSSQPPLLDLM